MSCGEIIPPIEPSCRNVAMFETKAIYKSIELVQSIIELAICICEEVVKPEFKLRMYRIPHKKIKGRIHIRPRKK